MKSGNGIGPLAAIRAAREAVNVGVAESDSDGYECGTVT